MRIIIDGYNVLKLINGVQHITDQQRQGFITLLNRYAQAKGHQITIVFDGGPFDRTTKTLQNSVEIIYAGPHISADEVILHLLDHLAATTTLIVTSDRSINKQASDRGFISLDSEEFYTILRQSLQQKITPPQQKTKAQKHDGYQSSSQLDALMEIASRVMMTKPEDTSAAQKANEQMLSKKEKKMQALLKKIIESMYENS